MVHAAVCVVVNTRAIYLPNRPHSLSLFFASFVCECVYVCEARQSAMHGKGR